VTDHFQKGRVFLGGDAVHLFTPTGGLGYNTAIEDAVNLGWKLAATLKGQGGPDLLATYEVERRPVAIRNTGYARRFADSLGLFLPVPEIEVDGPEGAKAREIAGVHLEAHARSEFNIPGVTFGGRYDGSTIVIADGTQPPPDTPNLYVPTACPGGRAPHIWLDQHKSLFDVFGFEWTLLRMGRDNSASSALISAAQTAGLELEVVDITEPAVRELYEADFALVRPDQVVAWRGNSIPDPTGLLSTVTGHTVDMLAIA
jgi:hypothetical protein